MLTQESNRVVFGKLTDIDILETVSGNIGEKVLE